jgi:hypothetical protein
MPEGQEVDADMNLEVGFERRDRGRLYQSVHAEASEETDVICNEDMIEATLACPVKQLTSMIEGPRQHGLIR